MIRNLRFQLSLGSRYYAQPPCGVKLISPWLLLDPLHTPGTEGTENSVSAELSTRENSHVVASHLIRNAGERLHEVVG